MTQRKTSEQRNDWGSLLIPSFFDSFISQILMVYLTWAKHSDRFGGCCRENLALPTLMNFTDQEEGRQVGSYNTTDKGLWAEVVGILGRWWKGIYPQLVGSENFQEEVTVG